MISGGEIPSDESPEWHEMLALELSERIQVCIDREDTDQENTFRLLQSILMNIRNRVEVFMETLELNILPFVVLPPGEPAYSDADSPDREHPEKGPDHNRIGWTLDLARNFDPNFVAEKHFFTSAPRENETKPYAVVLFPTYVTAVLVCNAYGNATYLVPFENWRTYATQHKIQDLRKMANSHSQDPEHTPWVSYLVMQPHEDESTWRMRLFYEIVTKNRQTTKASLRKIPWDEEIEAILDYILTHHGRYPSRNDPDPHTNLLARTIDHWRTLYGNFKKFQDSSDRSKPMLSQFWIEKICAAGIIIDSVKYRTYKEALNSQNPLLEEIETFRKKAESVRAYIDSHEGNYPPRLHPLSQHIIHWCTGYRNEESRQSGDPPKTKDRLHPWAAQILDEHSIIYDFEKLAAYRSSLKGAIKKG